MLGIVSGLWLRAPCTVRLLCQTATDAGSALWTQAPHILREMLVRIVSEFEANMCVQMQ
jgi:hypothetical protein